MKQKKLPKRLRVDIIDEMVDDQLDDDMTCMINNSFKEKGIKERVTNRKGKIIVD